MTLRSKIQARKIRAKTTLGTLRSRIKGGFSGQPIGSRIRSRINRF